MTRNTPMPGAGATVIPSGTTVPTLTVPVLLDRSGSGTSVEVTENPTVRIPMPPRKVKLPLKAGAVARQVTRSPWRAQPPGMPMSWA